MRSNKEVFQIVGGLPTPEMTAAYEAGHAPQPAQQDWRELLKTTVNSTMPIDPSWGKPTTAPSVPLDTSERISGDFLADFLNEITGALGGQVGGVKIYGFDEDGNMVEM